MSPSLSLVSPCPALPIFRALGLCLPGFGSHVSIPLTCIDLFSFVLVSMSLGLPELLSPHAPSFMLSMSLLSLPQFNPELVLVSAGFDAARGDPLGGCQVSPEGYAHLTHLLMGLANGHIILILEVTLSVPLPMVRGWLGRLGCPHLGLWAHTGH